MWTKHNFKLSPSSDFYRIYLSPLRLKYQRANTCIAFFYLKWIFESILRNLSRVLIVPTFQQLQLRNQRAILHRYFRGVRLGVSVARKNVLRFSRRIRARFRVSENSVTTATTRFFFEAGANFEKSHERESGASNSYTVAFKPTTTELWTTPDRPSGLGRRGVRKYPYRTFAVSGHRLLHDDRPDRPRITRSTITVCMPSIVFWPQRNYEKNNIRATNNNNNKNRK